MAILQATRPRMRAAASSIAITRRWREHRDATKFDRMLEFGRALPRIRRRVAKDLRLSGLPKEKVLATIVRLLECTPHPRGQRRVRAHQRLLRPHDTSRSSRRAGRAARLLSSFAARAASSSAHWSADRRIAHIVRDCRDILGQELFQWVDEKGERRPIGSSDVNDYLREASGGAFTAKDFRTWFATLEALEILRKTRAGSANEAKKQVLATVKAVSEKLGNTPTICRKCYIHPEVLSAHEAGQLSASERRQRAARA